MLVSVIVPIYNVAEYLPACIESVLSQTYKDFELLLVDDGSTDDSIQICEMYAHKDNRIRVFTKKNEGVSSARNMGIENCQGEWVAFIDGDDYVENEYLHNLLQAAAKRNNTDLVVAGFQRVDDSNTHNTIDKWAYKGELIDARNITFEQLEHLTFWGVSVSKLFKTGIIKQRKLHFADIPLKEDVVFLLQYIDSCELIQTTEHNDYYYVQRNGSALNSNRPFEQRILRHEQFRKEVCLFKLSRPVIKSFALHNGEWSIISEAYSFCNNPIKRLKILKSLNCSYLNPDCLTKYSMTCIDSFCIWLLKHKSLVAFDVIKRTQVHLLNLISVLCKLIK